VIAMKPAAVKAPKAGEQRMGVSGAPIFKEAITGCLGALVGWVSLIEELEGGKRKVVVLVGEQKEDVVVLVTNFKVVVGKLVAVSPVGSTVGGDLVSAKTLLGVETTGMLLDELTLGWADGSSGSALYLHPKQFQPGDNAPSSKPEKVREQEVDAMGNVILAEAVDSLFISKPKLTEEEKAKVKTAKAKAKRAAKGEEEEEEEEAEEPELSEPSKKDLKAAKKRAVDRRKEEGAEGSLTDEELESAGFLPQ
jgi:hypothetical protein